MLIRDGEQYAWWNCGYIHRTGNFHKCMAPFPHAQDILGLIHLLYFQELRDRIAKIPNLNFDTSPAALSQSVRMLKHIPVRSLLFIRFLIISTDNILNWNEGRSTAYSRNTSLLAFDWYDMARRYPVSGCWIDYG
jgi:hypothetical protein